MRLAPPDLHRARHARVGAGLRALGVEAALITSLPNIAYLSGFFATAGALVVSADRLILIADGRYAAAAGERQRALPGLEMALVPTGESYESCIAAVVRTFENRTVGFEAGHLTVRQHRDLEGRLKAMGAGVDLVATDGVVEAQRAVKDAWELHTLREAGGRLSEAAKCIIPKALAGLTELEVAAAAVAELGRAGFHKPAFDTIVAAGPNSAMPHHRAGERRLASGDLVILDFGGVLDGYAVDMTRTVAVGGASAEQQRLLERVAEAQAAAFAACVVGRAASEVDQAARDVLERAGLGEAFSHGTGHGLGLEVHERPRVSKARADLPPEPLAAGMVFTLEPGAYLAGWGGVRIEDDVAVTAGGAEWLTTGPGH